VIAAFPAMTVVAAAIDGFPVHAVYFAVKLICVQSARQLTVLSKLATKIAS